MADLVKRLRSSRTDPLDNEAADAIEELTEALRSSQQWLACYPGGGAIPAWKRNYVIILKYGASNG